MRKKGKISNGWFYRQYAIYGGLYLLLCGIILISLFNDFHTKIMIPAVLLILLALLVFFVGTVKKGILSILKECSASLDQAMDGQAPDIANEETELALFQDRLARFMTMRDKAFYDAKNQKEQIETLLADISHQTKTPIANILLYSQLLEERATENQDLIQKLSGQSQKLKTLIQSMVEMSRLENGIIKCVPKREALREFLIQVIGDYYDNAQAGDMEISLECAEEITAVFDWKWMREAIGNLVDNAIKYTEPGGRVDIKAIAYELFVRIDVVDTGVGLREEEIPRIFGRFYRSEASAGSEGLGLGLYLARDMVTAQGGYIKVSSQPGKGSDFQVFIPASF